MGSSDDVKDVKAFWIFEMWNVTRSFELVASYTWNNITVILALNTVIIGSHNFPGPETNQLVNNYLIQFPTITMGLTEKPQWQIMTPKGTQQRCNMLGMFIWSFVSSVCQVWISINGKPNLISAYCLLSPVRICCWNWIELELKDFENMELELELKDFALVELEFELKLIKRNWSQPWVEDWGCLSRAGGGEWPVQFGQPFVKLHFLLHLFLPC